jgi:hypothetical protein
VCWKVPDGREMAHDGPKPDSSVAKAAILGVLAREHVEERCSGGTEAGWLLISLTRREHGPLPSHSHSRIPKRGVTVWADQFLFANRGGYHTKSLPFWVSHAGDLRADYHWPSKNPCGDSGTCFVIFASLTWLKTPVDGFDRLRNSVLMPLNEFDRAAERLLRGASLDNLAFQVRDEGRVLTEGPSDALDREMSDFKGRKVA